MGYEDMMKWNLNIKKYAPILIGVALALVIVPQLWSANTAYAEVSQKVKNAVADCERVNAGSVGEIRGCLTNKLFSDLCATGSGNPDVECLDYIKSAIERNGGASQNASSFVANEKEKATGIYNCFSYTSPIASAAVCGALGVSWVLNSIMGLFVALGAWLAQSTLALSTHVTELPVIQRGFSVALALANLGFVLGIIVVAIATILRIESYGMKQILWKLVVMAILVNFSFAIAGSIVNFSNTITDYFINQASPSPSAGVSAYSAFISSITNGFAPQALSRPDINTSVGWDQVFVVIFSFLFNIIFLIFIALCFAAIAVLFLIRFVYLGVLLILMPLAWMMLVFPLFKSNWDKWWHNFLKWCFFAPLCVFFLHLAIASTQDKAGMTFIDQNTNTGGP